MALGYSAQFGFPEKLPEILPLVEAHAVGERHGVLGQLGICGFEFTKENVRFVQSFSKRTG